MSRDSKNNGEVQTGPQVKLTENKWNLHIVIPTQCKCDTSSLIRIC